MAKTGMDRLQELKGDIYRCIHCKACRFAYSGEPDKEGIGEHAGKQGTVRLMRVQRELNTVGKLFGMQEKYGLPVRY